MREIKKEKLDWELKINKHFDDLLLKTTKDFEERDLLGEIGGFSPYKNIVRELRLARKEALRKISDDWNGGKV